MKQKSKNIDCIARDGKVNPNIFADSTVKVSGKSLSLRLPSVVNNSFSLSDEAIVNQISDEKPQVLQLSKPYVFSVFHHEFSGP